ncbi:MAG: hypothetical protein IPP22_08640 [Nitrosomonas sp.]|nr:hypothetical protein [Nitrosomonas sp.]
MSLYNNVSDALSSRGGIGAPIDGATSIASRISKGAADMMGGGELAKAVTNIGGAMGVNVVRNAINKHIPIESQRALHVGGGVLGDLMRGDINAAGLRILDSGLLNEYLPGMSGIASQAMYWGRPTPLFVGISPSEAKRIYEMMRYTRLSKKNLFLIEVSSSLMGDWVSQWFNMFATELDYAPFIISGDKRKVGGAVIDSVQSSEPVEMHITTMDDQFGTIKRWYEQHHAATVARDGTVGVPSSYAIKFKVVHSFITRGSTPSGAYESIGWFRPSNLEVSLSRRDDGMQEIQMSFSQIDTFVKV